MMNGPDSDGSAQYYDLGKYQRSITTSSQEALTWFNRGLVWSYSYNHEEGLRCFERAIEHDAKCAMAYWGIAYAIGPNYNKSWRMFTRDDRENTISRAMKALVRAQEVTLNAQPVEKALIEALTARFPQGDGAIPEDMSQFDYAYAKKMLPVYKAYSDDPDVTCLFADAVMCTRPRKLWNLDTGKTTGADIIESKEAMEKSMASTDGRDHPGLCHLYIHMMEGSPYPELALPAADRLRRIVPEGSHMQHMATHIDIACGDYRRAIDSNIDAIASDDRYFAQEEAGSLLYNAYRSHNIHAMAYAAMMSGRCSDALYAANRLPEVLTLDFMSIKTPRMVDWTEWQLVTLPHVLIRFGRWEEVLNLELPADQELLCVTTALIKYARGVALAVLGRLDEARLARNAFEEARSAVPEDRLYGPSASAKPILAIASAMLEGELEYRAGNYTKAFRALYAGIELEDKLPYSDPPLWMQPVRHALGALLLEQGHTEAAEKLYTEDLGLSDTLPRRKARINNVWGLQGLYECFVRSGKHDQARKVRLQRDIALAVADIPVKSSCYCRLKEFKSENNCCF